jgi:hypothetical protein
MIIKALFKYDHTSFLLLILHKFDNKPTKLEILTKEQFYFDLYSPNYNIAKIAGNTQGIIPSLDTKLKISKSNEGKKVKFDSQHKKIYLWLIK